MITWTRVTPDHYRCDAPDGHAYHAYDTFRGRQRWVLRVDSSKTILERYPFFDGIFGVAGGVESVVQNWLWKQAGCPTGAAYWAHRRAIIADFPVHNDMPSVVFAS